MARSHRVAAIYAADKLANVRGIHHAEQISDEKLAHYSETLTVLCRAHPDLPFLGELRSELDRVMSF
jgi:hypothetical protein